MLPVISEFLTTLPQRLNPHIGDAPRGAYQIEDIRQAMLDCLGAQARDTFAHMGIEVTYGDRGQALHLTTW